jgi:hypothetical protein
MIPSAGSITQAKENAPGRLPGDGLEDRAEAAGHHEERDNENEAGHDDHQPLEGLGQYAADFTAEHRVGNQDGEDHRTDHEAVPVEQVFEELGAGLHLGGQVHRAAQKQHERQDQLDAAMVVETQVRQVAEAGDGADLGHGPHFLADHQVTEDEGRRTQHEQKDGIAGAVDQARHADHREGASDCRHRGESDGERTEDLRPAEKGLRRGDLLLRP